LCVQGDVKDSLPAVLLTQVLTALQRHPQARPDLSVPVRLQTVLSPDLPSRLALGLEGGVTSPLAPESRQET
jgi:hypothetical protein